ncbi:hypothetical protein PN462_12795 [Spirulina sp. CS-785/01]|uniref:alr0857 family protein n=1 Tax=Spirulina sp. CS-785/01 TaxID=3021716 RepID=UPI00232AA34D|nr:alr0857 family protein [Spirulina sp. CS-785/01]MDB9313983.1 hypothetical protein [Spirulina sp. CS-785/01]
MLKLTYTENGFWLEQFTQPMEDWVNQRVLLALRSGTPLYVEPSTAAFLLPMNLPHWDELEMLVQQEGSNAIGLAVCDEDYMEVSLDGTWLVSDPHSEEGIFVTTMSDRAEFFLYTFWKEAETMASIQDSMTPTYFVRWGSGER